MSSHLELTFTLLNGCGAMALVAVAFGHLERTNQSRWSRSALQGGMFGLGAMLAMHSSIEIMPGYYLDSRSIFVGFAGAFAGWPAAVVTVTITAIARIIRGGAGLQAALFALPIAAAAGLLWRRVLGTRKARLPCLAGLGFGISSTMAISVFVLPLAEVREHLASMALMVIANVGAALVLGVFIEREKRLILRERMLVEEARYDGLTGLPNRKSFERRANELLVAAGPLNPLSLLVLDLDHFKDINDSFGHAFGDEVLKGTAELLSRNLTPGCFAGRLGGEEFGIIVGGGQGELIAKAIRHELASSRMRFGRVAVEVTASIGVCDVQSPSGFDEVFLRADAALYTAKRFGRNRVELDHSLVPVAA